ncbi:MAG: hypothetical protein HY694_17195 [Deltaproteobacteria bacterium]|jgi:hypothetical protein|nr:hypothetical protein [Deltaproteobacteria bacterium]
MKSQEMFLRNQQLSTEFDRYVREHPDFADQIPDGALVAMLPFISPLVKGAYQKANPGIQL